jgi:hypothetical protein
LKGDKILVKFIRANRLLPWIVTKFEVRSTFLILRHPCATIASQIKTGIRGYFLSEKQELDQEKILKELGKIEELHTLDLSNISFAEQIELLALNWAVDSIIPLSKPEPHQWYLLTYEDLLLNEKELENILNELNEDNQINQIRKKLLVPSFQTIGTDFKGCSNHQILKWKKYLSNRQIEKISNVLSKFNIDFRDDRYNILGKEYPLNV